MKLKEFSFSFWAVEIAMLGITYYLYQAGEMLGTIILIAFMLIITGATIYEKKKSAATNKVSSLFEGDTKQLMNPEVIFEDPLQKEVPPILYVSSDKVYEIPRLEIDQWAKSDPVLRAKLEKIVHNHSLRATTNFHLLPEDRQALGMHILMDIGQEVYEHVYPDAISQAIEKMGGAFEKYRRSDLKREDIEGTYIEGIKQ